MIEFIVAVILTELLTELAVKSVIFKPARELFRKWKWGDQLVNCGYCFSVWAAPVVVFSLGLSYNLTEWHVMDFALVSLVVHRLSNVLHNIIDKWTDKYYSLGYTNSDKSNE